MLILTRHRNQRIFIGEDIVISYLGFDEKLGQAEIGIAAPKDVVIRREEVKIRDEKNGREQSE